MSDRAVAIKQFTLDMSPERLQQFAAELQHLVTAHLAHPGIAAPLAAGLHGASAYLVQELVTADSLDLVIREYGVAPPNDALRVAAQLAGALDFANAAQVRHGALHPRDVLLSSDETRVTGLGVAHALERVGIGAPVRRPYTPPERIAAGEWDRRSDVFSLAALAHELLWARRIAGTGSSVAAGLTPITGGDLNVLHAVFSRALAEDPAERFETALQFADALRSAFPDTEVKDQAAVLKQIEDDFAEGSTMFPQAQPVPAAAPPETRRPVVISSEPAQTPASTQPPLVDRKREIDLPLAEIARAEQERYRDIESAPALMPPAAQRAADAPDAASAGRYLDYVRNDQAVAAAPQAPAPIVVRPVLPEPTVTRETPRSNRVPVLLALAIGLMLGFGAGYGFGLRQRPAPAVASETADGTPAPGREFTESAVPDATRPAATPADAPPPAAGTDSRAAAPAAEPPAAPPPPAAAPPVAPPAATPAPAPAPTRAPAAPAAAPRPAAPVAPVAPPADGRILVRTTPAGARVFVDEREYGVTPFAVRNLARGGHRVRVMRDGYNTEDRRIVLTASQPSQSVTIALERQSAGASSASQARPAETGSSGRFAGDLVVDSRPPGATVFIDGKAVGTTPVTVRGVAAGSHAIRVEHEGYRRWSSAVRVVASQANRITAALER